MLSLHTIVVTSHCLPSSFSLPFSSSLSPSAGMDYFSIDATFSLSGTQQRCFDFISINDNIPELTETAVVTVMTLNSFGQVAEQRQVFIFIMDDDGKKILYLI